MAGADAGVSPPKKARCAAPVESVSMNVSQCYKRNQALLCDISGLLVQVGDRRKASGKSVLSAILACDKAVIQLTCWGAVADGQERPLIAALEANESLYPSITVKRCNLDVSGQVPKLQTTPSSTVLIGKPEPWRIDPDASLLIADLAMLEMGGGPGLIHVYGVVMDVEDVRESNSGQSMRAFNLVSMTNTSGAGGVYLKVTAMGRQATDSALADGKIVVLYYLDLRPARNASSGYAAFLWSDGYILEVGASALFEKGREVSLEYR